MKNKMIKRVLPLLGSFPLHVNLFCFRGTVKRVARAMDAADHKRFRDKYGDQFNYVYNTV
jgi:hypothetical protein